MKLTHKQLKIKHMKECEDCGCAVYNGHCTNCHEEVYIAEQHIEQGSYNETSDEFKQKVNEQLDNPQVK